MTRAESAGGERKTKAPDIMVTKIILVGLLHVLDYEWLMQHFIFILFYFFFLLSFESYQQTTGDALHHAWQKELR